MSAQREQDVGEDEDALAIVNVDDGGVPHRSIPDINPNKELARPLTAPFHNIGHLSKLWDFLVKQ
jgi:hypothetical protein